MWFASASEIAAVGVWSSLAPPKVARSYYTLTQLFDGTILMVGGDVSQSRQPMATVERYDPATDIWHFAAPLSTARFGHAATLLPDGRVLVIGGATRDAKDYEVSANNAEIYDPIADRWNPVPILLRASVNILAVNLLDGQVLIIGDDGDAPNSVVRYNPANGQLTTVASPKIVHIGGEATVLRDGTVLLGGGRSPCNCSDTKVPYKPTAVTEKYDPATDVWTLAAPMNVPRFDYHATLLHDGQVLVSGGDSVRFNTAERYDPIADRWIALDPIRTHALNSATLLPSGQVLVAGGSGAELYDPHTDHWQQTAPIHSSISGYALSVLLADGSVLIVNEDKALRYRDVATPPGMCFAETGHCVSGPFLDYWLAHGGLAVNGLPLTDERAEGFPVQYFERARFEFHYHHVAGPSDPIRDVVLLSQLGRQIHPLEPGVAPQDGSIYFAATGHNLAEPFRTYWLTHGELAQFGYPLGEVHTERLEDGHDYLVQYFERARFEYHPENDAANAVQLGQLGRRALAEYEQGAR